VLLTVVSYAVVADAALITAIGLILLVEGWSAR
jgi:hypothetical protein